MYGIETGPTTPRASSCDCRRPRSERPRRVTWIVRHVARWLEHADHGGRRREDPDDRAKRTEPNDSEPADQAAVERQAVGEPPRDRARDEETND